MSGERVKNGEILKDEVAKQERRARLAYESFEGRRFTFSSDDKAGVEGFLKTLSVVKSGVENPETIRLFGEVMVRIATSPAADDLSSDLRRLLAAARKHPALIEKIGQVALHVAANNLDSKQNYFRPYMMGIRRGPKYLLMWIEKLKPKETP